MTATWKILYKLPQEFTPHGLGVKTLGPTLNFDRTYLCNRTWYQQSERNLSIYRDSLIYPQIRGTLVHKQAENGWRVFAHLLNFAHWESLTTLPHGRCITDSRQTLGTCYVVAQAYSLEQQNVRHAHAELSHASSCWCSIFVYIFILHFQLSYLWLA